MARSKSLRFKLLIIATGLAVSGSVACAPGSDDGDFVWEGDAPFGTIADGTPDNEKVNPDSWGPQQSIENSMKTVDCLREAGFSASLDGDGRFGYRTEAVPAEQGDAYWEAVARCSDLYPITAPTSLSDAEWTHLYQANLRHADCLRKQGLFVSEAPSEAVWVDSRGGAWSPSKYYSVLPDNEWMPLLTLCPSPG